MNKNQDRLAMTATACVIATMLALFVFGQGPGSLVWLAGGAPRWLPFAGSGVAWLPFVDPHPRPLAAVVSPSPAKPSPSPSAAAPAAPHPVAAKPSPKPSPKPIPVETHPPSPAPTPTPPRPSPSPTPATLFADNFEKDALGSSVPGWSPASGGWSVAADGSHVLSTSSGNAVISAGDSPWTNYKVTASVKNIYPNGYAKVLARYQNNQNFYACGLQGNGTLFLGKVYGGTWYTFATAPYSVSPTTFYTVAFTVKGNSLTCTVTDPGGRTATVTSTQGYFANGSIGAAVAGNAEFDNFVVVSVG